MRVAFCFGGGETCSLWVRNGWVGKVGGTPLLLLLLSFSILLLCLSLSPIFLLGSPSLASFFLFRFPVSLTHSLTQHFRHTTIYDLLDSTLSLPGHQYHRHGQTRSCTTRDETERNKSKFHNTPETKITLPKMVVGIPPHLHPSRAHHNPTNVRLFPPPL